jgi:hypothetical protein
MSQFPSLLFDNNVLIGFQTTHISLGAGVVTAIIRENDNDYIYVQFESNGGISIFPAYIFLNQWNGGKYFLHALDSIIEHSRKLHLVLSNLSKYSINPNRTDIPLLDESDYRLCVTWAGYPMDTIQNPNAEKLVTLIGPFEAARLMSARVAELVAIGYFRELGCYVEDVSITQIHESINSQWRDFDLLVDGRPVDVKNARHSLSNPDSYVEHCVPRFKQDRQTNTDVSILGVLSKYQKPYQISEGLGACVILGEVEVTHIRQLYVWFRNRYKNLIDFKGLWTPEFQPGWAFEYTPAFYPERMIGIDKIESVIQLSNSLGIETEYINSWLIALCPNKKVINELNLSSERLAIFNDLYDLNLRVGLTRPALFIYIMAYSLEAIQRNNKKEQTIAQLQSIIFPSKTNNNNLHYPLGLTDSQKYIATLIDAFEQVIDAIIEQGIQFTAFKLQSPSILKGMTANGSWITLLAYCGGWIEFPYKLKCGATPLYLGGNNTCTACSRLICNKCGFCSDGCHLVKERQKKFADDNIKGISK